MGKVGFGLAVTCAVATCAIAAVLVGRRAKSRRRWERVVGVLREFEEGCSTPLARLRQVVDAMAVEMHAGLASDGGSKLKMLLTFVDSLPDGDEKGIYYALDLGGTNFRVLRVQLGGKVSGILQRQVESQPIPQELMTSTSEELFHFIAMTLKDFVEREGNDSESPPDKRRELGFTFSFPVRQTSVSSGVLIKWTKGFAIDDTVGRDVTECLEEAMMRRGLNMRVAALVNDTVGTLALGHYHDEDTVAAVVLGTGTNACYVERADAIIKCQGLLTNSGGMGFEKMISGMYLGDIARRVILRVAQESDIFGDITSSRIHEPFVLRTPMMAAMHEDDSPDLREVERVFRETLQITNIPLKARRLVVRVCDMVTRRAARLAAAGIVGILRKIGRDGRAAAGGRRTESSSSARRTVIAIEGRLYVDYSMFQEYLKEAMVEILGEDVAQNVFLRISIDGSGVGAALLATSHSSSIDDRGRREFGESLALYT
ncbi:Hexokinase-3 [Acorus gramineus]|uniref:Phosphotransferase n=1 Tax=Acorus gramineus TaxID=55184 RepID=A0AAV9BRV0_ACOGR|nr:Hexokinase-3 [Acorus gramineus]